jgi:hypothetical protein
MLESSFWKRQPPGRPVRATLTIARRSMNQGDTAAKRRVVDL